MARPNRNDLIAIIAVAFLFAMLAYLGMTLMRASERIALLWIPNAVVAALLIRSRSDSRVYFILACAAADLAVNRMIGDGWSIAIALSVANAAEIAVVVWAMQTCCW